MTPAQILSRARALFNEDSADLWSDDAARGFMWEGETIVASLIGGYETVDTSITTANGTAEYTIPADTLVLRRVTWNGVKLKKITLQELDTLEAPSYGGSLSTGNPTDYYEWGTVIGLYPTPTSAEQLKLWITKAPAEITSSSTAFSIHQMFHHDLTDYLLWKMYDKDDDTRGDKYQAQWERNLVKAERKYRDYQNRDRNLLVKNADISPETELGII